MEAGNKITILGFLGGDDLILPPDILGKAVPNLTFVIRLRDGEGKYKSTWSIAAPNGDNIVGPQEITVAKKPGEPNTVILTVNGHPVPEFGRYTLHLQLEGKDYPFAYELRQV